MSGCPAIFTLGDCKGEQIARIHCQPFMPFPLVNSALMADFSPAERKNIADQDRGNAGAIKIEKCKYWFNMNKSSILKTWKPVACNLDI